MKYKALPPPKKNADDTRAQRRDKQKDSYMSIELKFGFFLKQKRKRIN